VEAYCGPGDGYGDRMNWRRVRSVEFVTSRLENWGLVLWQAHHIPSYLPDFVKSRPFIDPAPTIL
jgi:hypothetical protein